MQKFGGENTNSLRHEIDGRQTDCQIRLLIRAIEKLQIELAEIKREREKDYERFSGDICDHGQRLKKVESKGEAGDELQQRAIKLNEYMNDVKAAKFTEIRGKFRLSVFQLNRTINCLMEMYPGRYEIAKCTTDKRERKLLQRQVI